jgi:hypothetical protein
MPISTGNVPMHTSVQDSFPRFQNIRPTFLPHPECTLLSFPRIPDGSCYNLNLDSGLERHMVVYDYVIGGMLNFSKITSLETAS